MDHKHPAVAHSQLARHEVLEDEAPVVRQDLLQRLPRTVLMPRKDSLRQLDVDQRWRGPPQQMRRVVAEEQEALLR